MIVLQHTFYITPATAKLAKKKGFNWEVPHYYITVNGKDSKYPTRRTDCDAKDWNEEPSRVSAPTQAVLQRWLREVYNLYITILYQPVFDGGDTHMYDFFIKNIKTKGSEGVVEGFETYEEALENGLVYALNLLKDEK